MTLLDVWWTLFVLDLGGAQVVGWLWPVLALLVDLLSCYQFEPVLRCLSFEFCKVGFQ